MKIVFLEPLGISQQDLANKINSHLGNEHEIVYYDNRVEDTPSLIERSSDADIVVLSNFKYNEDVIKHCPNLKMICVAFTGVDHIDMEYCREHNITVCNCAGYSTVAVADLVFGLVINLARHISVNESRCRQGLGKYEDAGFELEGKTFGIIGMGAIGQRLAKIANAFGCKVIAYNRSPKEVNGVTFMSMEDVLKNADIVSLHVPLSPATTGLIGESELALMKPTAMLINTARGPVVDTNALADALKNGKIAGAGIDVFDQEPPLSKDEPLLNVPNTIVTPHIAFASNQAFEKRADIVGTNIACWLNGNPQNVIK